MDTTSRKYGGPKGYGHIKESHSVRSARTRLYGFKSAQSCDRTSYDLSCYSPEPLNQNSTSSCEGHGWSGAIYTSCASAGKPLGFVPSPKGIYTIGRCLYRANNASNYADGLNTPLVDEGSNGAIICDGIRLWGIRPMGPAVTVDGITYNSDCSPDNINEEPTLLELESLRPILNEKPIPSYNERVMAGMSSAEALQGLIADLQSSFSQGMAVSMATAVDPAFEDCSSIITEPNQDAILGWHCMFLNGGHFDESEYRILGQNSWGKDWGRTGRFLADSQWLKRIEDLYAVPALGGV
jgi:hypothetical protein